MISSSVCVIKEDTMKLLGITIDFNDRKTCGLLPELCLQWDEKYDELEDNQELIKYWETNLNKVLETTQKIVSGNMGTKSILYSGDAQAIETIDKVFKEIKLQAIEYDDIVKCEHCLKYDYLDENFKH